MATAVAPPYFAIKLAKLAALTGQTSEIDAIVVHRCRQGSCSRNAVLTFRAWHGIYQKMGAIYISSPTEIKKGPDLWRPEDHARGMDPTQEQEHTVSH